MAGPDDAGLAKLGIRNNLSTLSPIPIDAAREDFIRSHNDMLTQTNSTTGIANANSAAITALQNASVVQAWQSPAYQNGYTGFGDPVYRDAVYKKLPSGLVIFSGIVNGSGGTAALMFVLPAGYRPARKILFPVLANDTPTRVDITAAGEVYYNTAVANSPNKPGYISLDGVAFWAEQ